MALPGTYMEVFKEFWATRSKKERSKLSVSRSVILKNKHTNKNPKPNKTNSNDKHLESTAVLAGKMEKCSLLLILGGERQIQG